MKKPHGLFMRLKGEGELRRRNYVVGGWHAGNILMNSFMYVVP